jgi:putative resolvase
MDEREVKDDLWFEDMIEVLTIFNVRLYGHRSARNTAKKAVESLAQWSGSDLTKAFWRSK